MIAAVVSAGGCLLNASAAKRSREVQGECRQRLEVIFELERISRMPMYDGKSSIPIVRRHKL